MNEFSSKLRRFTLISSVVGLICIAFVFFLPSDSINNWQLGFTTRRLALALSMSVVWLGFVFIFVSLSKKTELSDRFSARLLAFLENNLQNLRGIQIWTILFSALLGYFVLLFGSSLVDGVAVWLFQLAPPILWVLIIITQILFFYVDQIRKQENGNVVFIYCFITVLSVFIFFVFIGRIFDFTVDDAFITYRYSQNVVKGLGPIFNAGLPRSEGYTTFLWMVLMTIPHLFGFDVVIFSKLVGIICMLTTFLVTALMVTELVEVRYLWLRLIFASISTFLIASFPATAIHTISGMETALYTLLIAAMALVTLLGTKNQSSVILLAPLIGLLLGLTRPDGNMITIGLLVYTWLVIQRELRVKFLYACLFLYLLPGGIYYAWRTAYYGLPFPLSFYFKAVRPDQVFAGVSDVSDFLLTILPPLAVFIVLAFLRFRKGLFVLLIPVITIIGIYLFPEHIMGYNWRFLYPTVPLIFALASYGSFVLYLAIDMYSKSMPKVSQLKLFAVLLIIFSVQLIPLSSAGLVFNEANDIAYGMKNVYTRLGKALHDFDTDMSSLMAIGDAGAIPYYSQWEVIDILGLNNRKIALSDLPEVEYMAQLNPDLVVIASQEKGEFVRDQPNDRQAKYFNKAIELGMVKIRALMVSEGYYLWLLAYEESEIAQYLDQLYSKPAKE